MFKGPIPGTFEISTMFETLKVHRGVVVAIDHEVATFGGSFVLFCFCRHCLFSTFSLYTKVAGSEILPRPGYKMNFSLCCPRLQTAGVTVVVVTTAAGITIGVGDFRAARVATEVETA